MSNRKKYNIAGAIIIILMIVLYFLYIFVYRIHFEPSTTLTETNTDAAVYQLDDFKKVLNSFPHLFSKEQRARLATEKEYGTYVVPGLKATKTFSSKLHGVDMCTSMTPQGLAITEKYLLVSAYCHTHEHNSVIYVIDKNTHEFIKEVVLPGKPHAGGFAYDPDHDNVWVSGSRGGVVCANAYKLSSIENDSFDKTHAALSFDQEVPLTQLRSNSYMTYRNHALYVGCFDLKTEGELFKFAIDDAGKIVSGAARDGKKVAKDEILPIDYVTMPSMVQGISFVNEKFLMVSESYGMIESKLQIFKNTSAQSIDFKFSNNEAVQSYELPDKLEYACEADGKIYMLFEAAAYAYRVRPMYNVDRIITFHIDSIALSNGEKHE